MQTFKYILVAVLRLGLEPILIGVGIYALAHLFGMVTGLSSSAYGSEEGFGPWYQGAYMSLATLFSYAAAVAVVELRSVPELGFSTLPKDAAFGTLYGALALSSLIGLMYTAGSFHVTGVNEAFPFLQILAWVSFFAILEEVMFRGWLYRIFEERFGTWVGLIMSSVPFGLAHLSNPGATWFSTVSIVLAGFWLGMLFTASAYRLWVPIFAHIVWNYTQALWGTPVSGTTDFDHYLESNVTGPEWFTGGAFGPEGSYLCLGLLLILFVASYLYARGQGLIIPIGLTRHEIEVIEEAVEEVVEEAGEITL